MAPDLKARLRDGGPAVGCWLEMMSPVAAEIVAQAGYDSVMIDMEHGPAGYPEVVGLLQAVAASGTAPLVRVPANDPVALKRTLDLGVSGVMIPSVDSAAEAEAAVAACLYPPHGIRGMAPSIVRASDYGRRCDDYIREANDRLLVICQIETAAAVAAVEAIAAVEGLDMLFIGPFDLSASLGHVGEPDHPAVRQAIEAVEAAAKQAGCLLGTIPTEARPLEALLEAGYDLILPAADSLLLRDGSTAVMARWRALRGEGAA